MLPSCLHRNRRREKRGELCTQIIAIEAERARVAAQMDEQIKMYKNMSRAYIRWARGQVSSPLGRKKSAKTQQRPQAAATANVSELAAECEWPARPFTSPRHRIFSVSRFAFVAVVSVDSVVFGRFQSVNERHAVGQLPERCSPRFSTAR